ncbi:hypothetical protein EPN18_06755 [bacterium]|nr:MAG: hypothetical protein EPN18_06755 [bacterium]
MKKLFAVLCVGLLFTTGCASIISGTHERIAVNSLDDQTIIYVDGAARGRGSISLYLDTGGNHNLVAKKPGCQDVSLAISSSFNPVTLLNVFWLHGMIIAFPIDFIDGAAWRINPKDYTLTPICPVTPEKMPTPAI